MAFVSIEEVPFPGSGEIDYATRAVTGGTLHMVASRAPNGDRTTGLAFQPNGVSQEMANTVISDPEGVTLTAVQVMGANITRATADADVTDTLPDAADWVAAWPGVAEGHAYVLTIRNESAFAQTIAEGDSVTLNGGEVIAPSGVQSYLVVYASGSIVANAYMGASVITRAPYRLLSQNTTTGTLAAANLVGADQVFLENINATPGDQLLPAAALLVAAFPGLAGGQSYRLRIMNSGAGTFTLVVDAGATFTLVGPMTIPQDTYRDFLVAIADSTPAYAGTVTSIGSGTFD